MRDTCHVRTRATCGQKRRHERHGGPDAVDTCTLAELLAADLAPRVWTGDETARLLQRLVSRRRQLVKQRTRAKNEISAVLLRNFKGRPRPPCLDALGKAGACLRSRLNTIRQVRRPACPTARTPHRLRPSPPSQAARKARPSQWQVPEPESVKVPPAARANCQS